MMYVFLLLMVIFLQTNVCFSHQVDTIAQPDRGGPYQNLYNRLYHNLFDDLTAGLTGSLTTSLSESLYDSLHRKLYRQLFRALNPRRSLVSRSRNTVQRSRNFVDKPNRDIIFSDKENDLENSTDTRLLSVIIGAPTGLTSVTTFTMETDVHVTSVIEFVGTTAINGNGNILYLDAGGALQVDALSSLNIKNVSIKGINGSNIYCVDDTGNITLQNVDWTQSSDFTFAHGSLDIMNDVHCIGNGLNFFYTSPQACTIHSGAMITLDYQFTFQYLPSSALNNLLVFSDSTATMFFSGGALYAGPGGLAIKKGLLFFDGETEFSSASGITFGDGTAANDTICIFGSAAILNFTSGSLTYNNVLATSWNMRDINTILKINPLTTFNVLQNLNLGSGTLLISSSATFFTAPGAAVTGSVSFF